MSGTCRDAWLDSGWLQFIQSSHFNCNKLITLFHLALTKEKETGSWMWLRAPRSDRFLSPRLGWRWPRQWTRPTGGVSRELQQRAGSAGKQEAPALGTGSSKNEVEVFPTVRGRCRRGWGVERREMANWANSVKWGRCFANSFTRVTFLFLWSVRNVYAFALKVAAFSYSHYCCQGGKVLSFISVFNILAEWESWEAGG